MVVGLGLTFGVFLSFLYLLTENNDAIESSIEEPWYTWTYLLLLASIWCPSENSIGPERRLSDCSWQTVPYATFEVYFKSLLRCSTNACVGEKEDKVNFIFESSFQSLDLYYVCPPAADRYNFKFSCRNFKWVNWLSKGLGRTGEIEGLSIDGDLACF